MAFKSQAASSFDDSARTRSFPCCQERCDNSCPRIKASSSSLSIAASFSRLNITTKSLPERSAGSDRYSLLLILAGGIGNLIDRVLNGEVVDYINLLFMQFAVFNFADICVCVGVGLWVLVIFLEELHAENGQSPKEQ